MIKMIETIAICVYKLKKNSSNTNLTLLTIGHTFSGNHYSFVTESK